MKRWLFLVAFLAVLLAASRSSAAVVRDTTEFSVDLSAAHICWVLPHELRLASDCEGLTPDQVESELDKDFKSKSIAMGLVRMERHGEEPSLAVVTVTKVVAFGAVAADSEGSREYAKGAEDELRKDLPLGARLRPSDVHMVKPGALPLIRAAFTIDGIPEASDKKLTEQQIHHAVFTKDGGYVVVWVGRHEHKQRLEKLADAAAPTIAVTNPAGSRKQLEKTFEAIFTIAFAAVSGLAILVGFIIAVTRKKRQPAYAGYAYGYPQHVYSPPPGPYGAPPYSRPPPYSQPPPSWQPHPSQHPQPPASQGHAPTQLSPSTPPAPPPASYEPPKSWWDQPR